MDGNAGLMIDLAFLSFVFTGEKMIKSIIRWIVLFIITLYCCVIYKYSEFFIWLMALEIIVGVVAMAFVITIAVVLKPEMQKVIGSSQKGNKIKVIINLTKKKTLGLFRYGNCFVTVKINDLANGTTEKKKYRFALVNTVNNNIVINLPMENCGIYSVGISDISFGDVFNVFKIKKKMNKYYSVKILPEYNLIPVEVTRYTREFINDADVFSSIEGGDDPSETFEIREYERGDSPGRIHWKMSAKEHKLMVKDKSKPLGPSVLLMVDLYDSDFGKKGVIKKRRLKRKDKANDVYRNNLYLDICASLMISLLNENVVHMIIWYEADRGKMYAKIIRDFEDMYVALDRMLYEKRHNNKELANAVFEDFLRGFQFSSTISLNVNSKLFVNGEEMNLIFDSNKRLDYKLLNITV